MRKYLLSVLILLLVCSGHLYAMEFGNLAVFADGIDTDNLSVQIESDTTVHSFAGNDKIIIWNIHPGVHQLQLLDDDNNIICHTTVNVYPNLTNDIRLIEINDVPAFIDNGFADQAGHLFALTREQTDNMPGELSDGLGGFESLNKAKYQIPILTYRNISWGSPTYSRTNDFTQLTVGSYNYDGLQLSANSNLRTFKPSAGILSSLAIINLGDPFAGYDRSEVSLISNFTGRDQFYSETVLGQRERRYYRGSAGYNLPNDIGYVFGSVNLADLTDGFPRSNVEDVLPHNSLENSEITAGGGFNILPKIKSEFRLFYSKYKDDIYDHHYYFDLAHAPREEGYFYRGKLSVFGQLPAEVYFDAGFALQGDEYEIGDGLHFDNIPAYHHNNWPSAGNPDADYGGLFWSWDDMYGVTPDIDEAHVYDDYYKEKSKGWKFSTGLTKELDNSTQLFMDAVYAKSNYRKLHYLYPANGDIFNVINIGYDINGNEIDEEGLTELPKPSQIDISVGFKHIEDQFSATGALDYFRFKSNTKALKDLHNPFINDDPRTLDEADLISAKAKSKMGYRLALDYTIYENVRLFSNFSVKYYPPAYQYLYNNLHYLGLKIAAGGYYYVFGNPDLEPEQSRTMEVGVSYKKGDNCFALSYQNLKSDNLITATIMTEVNPKSYPIYLNQPTDNWGSNDFITFSFQRGGNNFFTCAIAASLMDFDFDEKRLAGIGWLKPSMLVKEIDSPAGKILSRLTADFSFEYKPGVLYTPMSETYNPVTLISVTPIPAGAINSRRGKDFFELNVGITASIFKLGSGGLYLRGEVINLLDRANYLNVYSTSGEPDNTGWLFTEAGQTFIENSDTVSDSSGLTGEQKYILASDDPNNFGRPRMFRFIARLTF